MPTTRRLAIRHGDVLLAVPPLDPRLPRSVRVRVFELVLRRQFGLADTIARIELDVIEGREKADKRLASLIAEDPFATARVYGSAA